MNDNFVNIEKNNLKLAIFRTLIWFDLFNYPLSIYEIWQYLDCQCEFRDLQALLNKEGDNNAWETKGGFYYLANRSEIIKIRLARYNYTDRKFKTALKISRLFKLCPTVQLISVSNIIGAHNLRAESDIDLFIVSSKNRIWLTRLFCAGLAKLLNLRPNKTTKENKICLSFYIDEDNLNLETLKLDSQDFYFNYWLAGLVPIYNRNSTYERLLSANGWLKNYLPNFIAPGSNPRRQIKKDNSLSGKQRFNLRPGSVFTSVFNPLSNFLERSSRAWQLKILPPALKDLANKDSRVIIKSGIIKLYLVDRREELREKYRGKLKANGRL
ncbi:MAG: hypothetical protein NTX66_02315 [Candidatus Falkowbacteria bacterium]|nr:hypothetical protein [Candidatus Falkowbacteria bacterium]